MKIAKSWTKYLTHHLKECWEWPTQMIPKRTWAHQYDLHIHPGSIHRARNRVAGCYIISLLHKEARLEFEVAKVAGTWVVKSQREGNFREVNPKAISPWAVWQLLSWANTAETARNLIESSSWEADALCKVLAALGVSEVGAQGAPKWKSNTQTSEWGLRKTSSWHWSQKRPKLINQPLTY